MTPRHDPAAAVAALRRAIPYLRLYQGRIFVVKAGGEAFATRESSLRLLEQVGILHQLGIRAVLVHGGGPQATALGQRLGVEAQFVGGRRVTGLEALEAAILALNGQVSTAILGACRELGLPGLGVSGVDAGLLRARRRPMRETAEGMIDYGFVGDLEDVDASVLLRLLDQGFLPVVSPLSADAAGTLLNVNADDAAARLACALGAVKLILATGAAGILRYPDDPRSVVSYTDLEGLRELRAGAALREGMLPKAEAIEAALNGGVARVHVVSFRVADSLLMEVFTNEGSGTLIVSSREALRPAELAT